MASYDGDEKWEDHDPNYIEEEEEEALSLCDLPVIMINEEKQQSISETPSSETENFEFGSWCGSVLTESEMCAADDVFFQGQILPLRPSISSDNGLPGNREDSRNPSRCGSRSESMEHSSSGGFTSMSSSSSRSHHSSTTTNTTTTTYKPKLRNQFHSHPSPKPQVRSFGSRPGNVSGQSRRWTVWGFFRVGLVRTPEIELRDLKLRNKNKSFNSSSSGSGSGSGSSCSTKKSNSEVKLEKKRTQRFLFESCKCSVGAVETVSSRIVVIKSSNNKKVISERKNKHEVVLIEEEDENDENKKLKQRKQAMYHRRTFEWLKELSLADVLDEALS